MRIMAKDFKEFEDNFDIVFEMIIRIEEISLKIYHNNIENYTGDRNNFREKEVLKMMV